MKKKEINKKIAVFLTACLLSGAASSIGNGEIVSAAGRTALFENTELSPAVEQYNGAAQLKADDGGIQVEDSTKTDDGEDIEYYEDYTYVVKEDGTVEIRSYYGYEESVKLPDMIDGKKVTSIGDGAFTYGLFKSIEIPDSITEIGEKAFSGSSITSFTIPEGVTSIADGTFSWCVDLKSITIPDSVTGIWNNAFSYCSGLESVTIPEGVTTIGANAFAGCGSLQSITIPKGASVGNDAFWCCENLKNAVISEEVAIGESAFLSCSSLEGITVAKGVVIGEEAFCYCSSLKEIDLGEGVKIGTKAFSGCSNLSSLTIPTGASIGEQAFYYCTGLTTLSLTEGVTEIGKKAFSSCENITSVVIPKGIITIPESAFEDCTNLTTLMIPEGVTDIDDSAFAFCDKLTEVTIPNGVVNIGEYVFLGCDSLVSAVIPESVVSIGNGAFSVLSDLVISGRIGSAAERYAKENYIDFVDPLHTHSYIQTETLGPFCAAEGEKTFTCSVCGDKKTEVVPAAGHNYQPVTIKATTGSNGSTYMQCSVCGAVKDKTDILTPSTVHLSAETFVYDGKAKNPSVTVKNSGGAVIDAASYTVSYSNNKSVGQGSVTVTFRGNYEGSITKKFTIVPKGTSISKLTAAKKAISVKWKKQSAQASGYEIQYSTSSKFTKKTTATTTVKKSSTTSASVKKLKAKKKYYVRIRTFKTVKINGKSTNLYSEWSKTKNVKTK